MESMAPQNATQQHSERPSDGNRLEGRVLLVEDHPFQQRTMAKALKGAGADVTLECNGQAALDNATRLMDAGDAYNLILMDLRMPELDGRLATQELRARGYEGPIIMISADKEPGIEERCRQAGCNGFLSKPLEIESLLQMLKQM